MKKSIGIDISKKKIDVSLFDGKKHKQSKYENSKTGIAEMIRRMGRLRTDELLITMEATGSYHLRTAVSFHEAGYSVSVINPLIIKRYGEMKMLRAKTDAVDARLIAEYGYDQKFVKYDPRASKCQEIIHYLKAIEGFSQIRTQNTNRLEALMQSPWCPPEAINSITKVNETVDIEIKRLEACIREIIRQVYNKEYERLISIPGIGERTASAIIGYFGTFELFETSKQVASFIGVNPSPKQSGSSVNGRGSISKKGNGYLRKLFFMAALSAKKYNQDCSQLYNRLISEKKLKKVALIAVANKLIRQAFAILKYQREYIPFYQPGA